MAWNRDGLSWNSSEEFGSLDEFVWFDDEEEPLSIPPIILRGQIEIMQNKYFR